MRLDLLGVQTNKSPKGRTRKRTPFLTSWAPLQSCSLVDAGANGQCFLGEQKYEGKHTENARCINGKTLTRTKGAVGYTEVDHDMKLNEADD